MQPIVKEDDVGYWYEEAVQQNHCLEEGGSRYLCHDSELAGLILGAAAGMAFAALESSGYAFSAFLRSGGSLSLIVLVTLLRGLLSPLGHGPWTAILAGVLFRESAAGRFHINRTVMGAYLTVAILHGLWDGLPGAMAALFSCGVDVIMGRHWGEPSGRSSSGSDGVRPAA